MNMKKRIIILGLLLPLCLFGCSTDDNSSSFAISSSVTTSENVSSNNSEETISVKSISLSETSMDLSTDDSFAYLTATVLPDNATNKDVIWSSSKSSVATVNNGTITIVGEGAATITAKTMDGNKTATCTITVTEPIRIPNYVLHGSYYGESGWTDKQMVINPASMTEYMIKGVTLYEGDEFKVHMYGKEWFGYSAVKNSTKSGLVTAAPTDDNIKVLTSGVYDIYCNYNYSDEGHIYIGRVDETDPIPSVVGVTGISLSNTGKYLLAREEFNLTASIYPSNATNKTVYWTSSDTSIATVSSGGHVVANKENKKGTATITARTADGDFTATCIVYASAKSTVTPDYCLVGKIGGYSKTYFTQRYSAIPLSSTQYLIPDVELLSGDYLSVIDNYGARLKKNTQYYVKEINENMSVNVYLNPKDSSQNYLTLEKKYNS